MAEAPSVVRLTARVSGRVQGVGYRFWAHHASRQYGVTGGTVKNLPDGGVEVIAEASERKSLEQFLHDLHLGPTQAQVTAVNALWEEKAAPRFSGGEITVVA